MTVAKRPGKQRRTGAGYTLPAAAEELGISYRTMMSAVANGQVKAIQFGGLRRIPQVEVDRLRSQLFDSTSAKTPAPLPANSPDVDLEEVIAVADIRVSRALAGLGLTLPEYLGFKNSQASK